jgi:hypothetical protein
MTKKSWKLSDLYAKRGRLRHELDVLIPQQDALNIRIDALADELLHTNIEIAATQLRENSAGLPSVCMAIIDEKERVICQTAVN